MVPWPVGDGNCASLNSVEPVSRLLWRSSKLTDGRKSKDEAVSPRSVDEAGPFRLDENKGWALADAALSIGSSVEMRWGDGGFDRSAKSRVLQADKGLARTTNAAPPSSLERERWRPKANKGRGDGVPSRRRVVCWAWSSGPLMLPKHQGISRGNRSERSVQQPGQSPWRARWWGFVSLLLPTAAVLSPRRGSEGIQRLPHSERGCDGRVDARGCALAQGVAGEGDESRGRLQQPARRCFLPGSSSVSWRGRGPS